GVSKWARILARPLRNRTRGERRERADHDDPPRTSRDGHRALPTGGRLRRTRRRPYPATDGLGRGRALRDRRQARGPRVGRGGGDHARGSAESTRGRVPRAVGRSPPRREARPPLGGQRRREALRRGADAAAPTWRSRPPGLVAVGWLMARGG